MSILTEADEENEIASNFNSLLTLRQKVFNRSNVAFFLIDRRTSGAYDFIDESETSNSVMGLEYNLASADSKWNGRLFLHKSQTQHLRETTWVLDWWLSAIQETIIIAFMASLEEKILSLI